MAGPNRNFCPLSKLGHSEIVNKFRAFLYSYINEENLRIDPNYGEFMSVITDKGFVHNHKDQYSDLKHFRGNLMLSRPNIGGQPIIDGKLLDINEGDL